MPASGHVEIDISAYSDMQQYVTQVEQKLNEVIRFYDIETHPNPMTAVTHFDLDFCCEHFPAVWVDELHSLHNPAALLAHEVMHAQLIFVERYPATRMLDRASESEARAIVQMRSVLQDLVVEDRLLDLCFDRLLDFEDVVDRTVKEERQGPHYVEPDVAPEHCELIEAFRHTRLYLSRYAERRHKDRLRKVYKDRQPLAWAYAKHIIRIVKSTPDIFQPEGQRLVLKRLGRAFDLDNAYEVKVARGLSSFNEVG